MADFGSPTLKVWGHHYFCEELEFHLDKSLLSTHYSRWALSVHFPSSFFSSRANLKPSSGLRSRPSTIALTWWHKNDFDYQIWRAATFFYAFVMMSKNLDTGSIGSWLQKWKVYLIRFDNDAVGRLEVILGRLNVVAIDASATIIDHDCPVANPLGIDCGGA